MVSAPINLHLAGILHPDPGRLYVQHFQQSIVILVEQDGRAGCRPQFHRAAHVINVCVSNDDLFDLEIVLADEGENIFDVIARINHHGFTGDVVPDHRTVALERPHGEDFVNHGGSLSALSRQLSVCSLC
jgi:hypothetical protein